MSIDSELKPRWGDRELVQQLGAHTALAEDERSVSSTHTHTHITPAHIHMHNFKIKRNPFLKNRTTSFLGGGGDKS